MSHIVKIKNKEHVSLLLPRLKWDLYLFLIVAVCLVLSFPIVKFVDIVIKPYIVSHNPESEIRIFKYSSFQIENDNLVVKFNRPVEMIATRGLSMYPAFYNNSAVLFLVLQEDDVLKVGDVIVFDTQYFNEDVTVIHRITFIDNDNEEPIYHTKADNVYWIDPIALKRENITGIVITAFY